ncbi:MAG: DUF4861 domain-containing protein [Fidelibacterota bacterium]|nr:MAG: DUF4861 domain-containing protein [Candidatus Neomarinimicrobiota bacterium]
MHIFRSVIISIALILISSCTKQESRDQNLQAAYPESITLSARNPLDLPREDAVFTLAVEELTSKRADFNPEAFVVLLDSVEIASQGNDLDGDGQVDQVVCVGDLEPGAVKEVTVRYAVSGESQREYPRRTQAEISHKTGGQWEQRKYIGGSFENVSFLRVPDEHTDHSTFIRYEGPGWESDRVGYRFYLDWRNAIDIFGKKVTTMVLQDVGQDGFDSYHEMSDWGMDILKVGESLGIGSLGMWLGDRAERVAETDSITSAVVANGPVQAIIRTDYYGWNVGGRKYMLSSQLSISAGSRATRHDVTIEPVPENLCTGIVKHPDAQVLNYQNTQAEWAYLGTYGPQSLAGDELGMAIIYRVQDLIELTEDQHSLVATLRPRDGKLTYYFLAAWQMEPDGIRTEGEFTDYLGMLTRELDSPVEISP